MMWWHRLVLAHDQVTNWKVPVVWFPGDGDPGYRVIDCSCGKRWAR